MQIIRSITVCPDNNRLRPTAWRAVNLARVPQNQEQSVLIAPCCASCTSVPPVVSCTSVTRDVIAGSRVADTGSSGSRNEVPVAAESGCTDPLQLVRLRDLIALTSGRSDLIIGLVDGPVAMDHPELTAENVRMVAGAPATCHDSQSAACRHGTFVAGILAARRGANAPAIAPDCTLVVRPIFREAARPTELPTATPAELAIAIIDCVEAGARILNLSVALTGQVFGAERELDEALEYTRRRNVIVVTAAGNQGFVGSSTITRHRWVIPAVAYALSGRPLAPTNMGRGIGLGGVGGPGDGVLSLSPSGGSAVSSGTSIAAPFVAGAAALLWSLFPSSSAAQVKHALLSSAAGRPRTIIPPLMDAWKAYNTLAATYQGATL
jgi:subtilisin family serine protease